MKTQTLKQLEKLNFSQSEAKVYLALSEVGQTSAGEIIKKTQFHRSVVYETLDKLIQKKLVFKLEKNKISYFQITDPSRILQNIESQKELAESLIPSLKKLSKEKLPEIVVYEGVESYKQFWIDSLKNMPIGSTDYVAGSMGDKWFEYMGKDFKKYDALRIKRKIKWKIIAFGKDQLEVETPAVREHPKLTEYRLIDRKIEKLGNFNILANQALVLNSSTEPMVIEIKNDTLIKVFKNLFDFLWELGKKY